MGILIKDKRGKASTREKGSIYRDRSRKRSSKWSVSREPVDEIKGASIDRSITVYTTNFIKQNYINNVALFEIKYVSKMWGNKNALTVDRIPLEINNETHFLPKDLNKILDQIEEAKEVLDYSHDWDGEGATETDKQTFGKAATFVVSYANWVYEYSGAVLKTPYIDIMLDGAISVLWETEKAKLLIIFNKEENLKLERRGLAYFYAVNNQTGIPFKSAVDPNAPVDEILGQWMEKNLT